MAEIGDITWLTDVDRDLVIEGRDWRRKVAQLQALPHWFYTPAVVVQDYLDGVRRGEKPEITDDGWAQVKAHIEGDFLAYLWHFAYYKNRDTRALEMATPTPAQIAAAWRIMECIAAGRPVRFDDLKTRQSGKSWFYMNLGAWVISFHNRIVGVHAANDKDTAVDVFGYLKEAHEWLPDPLRPKKEHSSRKELVLREPDEGLRRLGFVGQDSRLIVKTAGTDTLGTGSPVQFAVGDEVGKWPGAPGVAYTSLVNAIQFEPWTFIIRVSTARGAGTFWHKCWVGAMNIGAADWNGHTPVFSPWYIDPRNAKPCPPGQVWGRSVDDEFGDEVTLRETYDLDDNQLWWRRLTVMKQGDDRPKLESFCQEHPSSQAEAWLYAFGKWLEAPFIVKAAKTLETEVKRGQLRVLFRGDFSHRRDLDKNRLEVAQGRPDPGKRMVFLKDGQDSNDWLSRRHGGHLVIYRLPDPRQDYVVGADVAEGDTKDLDVTLERGENAGAGDHSCAQVYQRIGYNDERDLHRPMRLAAELYLRVDTPEFAHMLWRLGWWYACHLGDMVLPALLVWEKTGPGRGIAAWLRHGLDGDPKGAYPSSRMYRRNEPSDPSFKVDSSYGVSTNKASKPVMMADWKAAVGSGEHQINTATLLEAERTQKNERGLIVTGGKDRLMASVLAAYGAIYKPPMHGFEVKKEDEPLPGSVRWALKARRLNQERQVEGSTERLLTK